MFAIARAHAMHPVAHGCPAHGHGQNGRQQPPFLGMIGRHALAAGGYRMVIGAIDSAGKRSIPRNAAFRVAAR